MKENIEKQKQVVLNTTDCNELRVAYFELTEMSCELHKQIHVFKTKQEHYEIKSNLTMVNSLLNICKERQPELNNKASRFNYNFRMAAKKLLSKDKYNEVSSAAELTRYEFKLQQQYK